MLARMVRLLCVSLILTMSWVGAGSSHALSAPAQPKALPRAPELIYLSGVLNVPASAFRPQKPTSDYINNGRYFSQLNADSDVGTYYAPVNLPDGASITKLTFNFRDSSDSDATLGLHMMAMSGGAVRWAHLTTNGTAANPLYGSLSTNVAGEEIDNSQYAYYLNLELPDSDGGFYPVNVVWACSAYIEYTYPTRIAGETDHFSMSMAAFTPYEDGYDYTNNGFMLQYNNDPNAGTNNGWFSGQVSLPDGAVVTKVQFYYYLDSNAAGVARLQRSDPSQGNYDEMATVYTGTGSPGSASMSDDTISQSTIDNERYTYWVIIDIPAYSTVFNHIWPYGAIISYTWPDAIEKDSTTSISMASFVPLEDGYDYQDHSRYLFHLQNAPGGSAMGWYSAPLYAPDGAYVKDVTYYWYDTNDSVDANGWVDRIRIGASEDQMELIGEVDSSNSLPYAYFSKEASLTQPVIDNHHYTYWVVVYLPLSTGTNHLGAGDVAALGVIVHYTYHPAFIPLVVNGPTQ